MNYPLADETAALQIGAIYLTRCVQLKKTAPHYDRSIIWWPILGHLVTDAPALFVIADGKTYFEQRHFHVDPRFSRRDGRIFTADFLIDETPSLQPLEALRETVPLRTSYHAHNLAHVKMVQEHMYANGTTCAKRNICPHKGARLDIAPHKIADGRKVFVCPNHGLMFDQVTGIMVQQFEDACNPA